MSGVTKKLISASGGVAGGFTAIEDVFSTYLYTGNGSTQTITNYIDLAGEGGLVWLKARNDTYVHKLMDTNRGPNSQLESNAASGAGNQTTLLTAFNSDGFNLGSNAQTNASSINYASWTFRKAPRFFDVVTYTGDGVAGREIPHGLGTEPGFIVVKRLDGDGWHCFHRSLGVGKYLRLESTSGELTFGSVFPSLPTSTDFTLGNDGAVNQSGGSFVAYLFAHDPLGPSGDGSDGLIDCGSYTGGGTGVNVTVNLGWEPQWILVKNTSAAGDWYIVDTMRGLTVSADEVVLSPNLSAAEDNKGCYVPTATGFFTDSTAPVNISGNNYIYIAIRRGPMRAPTSGTEVYSAGVVQDNTGRTLTNPLGYPSDMAFTQTSAGGDWIWQSRLTGTGGLFSNNTFAEATFYGYGFGNNTNYEADATASLGAYGWNFRRAPEFFDVVAYTGDGTAGRTVPHNLGVAPEMIIQKKRSATDNWHVYHRDLTSASFTLYLNHTFEQTNSPTTWNSTAPTDSVFTIGGDGGINASGSTHIAYLFATLAGVSKVGSYTGNGSSQTINCGFTTGARFILIKRTDAAGDWYVWDTARGIVAGNDPFLELNTTDAEVTSDDSIDPDSSGFIVNQTATTNVNVNAASYIFYAIS